MPSTMPATSSSGGVDEHPADLRAAAQRRGDARPPRRDRRRAASPATGCSRAPRRPPRPRSSASSRGVMPQILMRGTCWTCPHRRRGRRRSEDGRAADARGWSVPGRAGGGRTSVLEPAADVRTDVRRRRSRCGRRRAARRTAPRPPPTRSLDDAVQAAANVGRRSAYGWPAVTVLGRSPRVTSTVFTLPLRTSVTLTLSPDVRSATAACRSLSLRMSLPATLVMMSPPSWIGWLSSVAAEVAAADARLGGRAAGRDLLHERAVVDGHDVLRATCRRSARRPRGSRGRRGRPS